MGAASKRARKSAVAHAFLRAVSPFVATSHPLVAHALSAPRRAPVAHGSAVVLPRLAAVVSSGHNTSKIPSSSFHATYPTRPPLAPPPHRTLEPVVSAPAPLANRPLNPASHKRPNKPNSPRTPVKSAPFKDEPRSADLAFEIRGFSSRSPGRAHLPVILPSQRHEKKQDHDCGSHSPQLATHIGEKRGRKHHGR